MIPFFFGPPTRALYGVYHPPASGHSTRGAVLCNALGREYYYSHRTMRTLARRLAAAGVHTLRFDYLGTGDSMREVDEVELGDWLRDVAFAVEEIGEMADLGGVVLVGLRAGADLAAQASHELEIVDKLVLWRPLTERRTWFDQLEPPAMRACFPPSWIGSRVADLGPLGIDVLTVSPEAGDGARSFDEPEGWLTEGGGFGGVPMPATSMEAIVEWSTRR